jgi:3,4-dihydroxy 2-butanone 4-phosphate synthase/GTP cyclohydrolase II
MFKFDSIDEAIADLKAGKMIILVDDEDRENEGDFVMAAECVTAEAITLMTRQASGIITVPMPEERLLNLGLELMVRENTESMRTAFTITVDAVEGTTTGSSASDRATTIRRLADPQAKAEDFNRPGHVNPLMARKGGVLKLRLICFASQKCSLSVLFVRLWAMTAVWRVSPNFAGLRKASS